MIFDLGNTRARRTRHTASICALLPTLLVSGAVSALAMPMPTSGPTSQPIGHYEFCRRAPDQCQPTGPARPHQLTDDDWAQLADINTQVNASVSPRTDAQIWGRPEVWSFPTDVGDCEDYVLLKRRMLMANGFHPSNLLITVVQQPDGEGHAVLTVRTDRGDFILDNLAGEIADWRDTPYTYLKRQSVNHAGLWDGIDDHRTDVGASG